MTSGIENNDFSRREIWKRHREELKQRLEQDVPELVAGKEMLGLGSYGAVLDNQDDTVTKLFLRSSKQTVDKRTSPEQLFQGEIAILERLSDQQYHTAHTPTLFEVIELPTRKEAFAAYRMTKFSGGELDWEEFVKEASEQDIESHFRNAGAVLASFHTDAALHLAGIKPPAKGLVYGTSIDTIPNVNKDIHKALSLCDQYLKDHMEAGINHGDFHPLNFRVNDDLEITGLFDTSFAGETPNYLIDLTMMPEKGLVYAIDEYQKITGKNIDPLMVTMTQISQDVAVINWHQENPQGSADIIKERMQSLVTRLNQVSSITGMRFDEEDTLSIGDKPNTEHLCKAAETLDKVSAASKSKFSR